MPKQEGGPNWRAWSSDGRYLAVLGQDGTLALWQADNPAKPVTLGASRSRPDRIDVQAWSPDSQYLAVGSEQGVIRLRKACAGSEVRPLAGHAAGIRCLVWSRDGRRLASADAKGVVKVWGRDTGEELGQFRHEARLSPFRGDKGFFEQMPKWPVNLAWSPKGDRLAVAGDDSAIGVYDLGARRQVQTLHSTDGPKSIAWNPVSERLASTAPPGDQSGITIWDMAAGQDLLSLPGCGGPLAWSADGWRLQASIPYSRQPVAVWDATPLDR
jgi:WD40 repeat protein